MFWFGELLLQYAQLDGERDQLLLRVVVQVALQLLVLGHAGFEDVGARGVELRARFGALECECEQLGEVGQVAFGVRFVRV